MQYNFLISLLFTNNQTIHYINLISIFKRTLLFGIMKLTLKISDYRYILGKRIYFHPNIYNVFCWRYNDKENR